MAKNREMASGRMPGWSVALSSLLGALVLGMLWRFRGSHGWGGEDGLLNAGFIFAAFLVILTGGNAKTTPSRLAVTALAFTCSTPAWGTLLNQMRGLVFSHPSNFIFEVSPVSGAVMMLLLGFGISGIFGILVGSMFSGTRWSLWHFLVLLASFYAIMFLCRATVCHPIIAALQPQSVDVFNGSLAKAGIGDGVYKAYMSHFDNMPWAKGFDGGRNYVAEVGTISMAIATAVCLLVTRFWIKDRTSARIGLLSALSFSFAITFSDLLFVVFSDTGRPALVQTSFIHAWGCWEYFTGFFAGGLLTFVVLKCKSSSVRRDGCLDFLPPKVVDIAAFLVTFAVIGYNFIRPVVLRFDNSPARPYVAAGASVVFALAVLFAAVKSKLGSRRPDNFRFCMVVFLFLVVAQGFVYYFGAGEYAQYKDILRLEHLAVLVSLCTVVPLVAALLVKDKRNYPNIQIV